MTKVAGKDEAPKTKAARTNQRAIFATPVRFEGELPEKKKGGRKSQLAPVVEKLKADPDQWYKIANGLKGTISQMRVRLIKLDENIQADTHADPEKPDTHSDCFARYNTPKS